MPEMNGLEIILELPRAFLDVKVIALSERSVDDSRRPSPSRPGGLYRNRLIWTSCFEPFSMSCNISHKEHHASQRRCNTTPYNRDSEPSMLRLDRVAENTREQHDPSNDRAPLSQQAR